MTAYRRNPEKYYFSVFGEPSDTGTWGFRVEGHHLSQNFAVVNGKIADTPSFFGSNPAEVREGPRKGLRVLAAEEDLARDLLESLSAEQKKAAIVTQEAYKDILTAASRKAALEGQPSGLSAAKMNKKQFDLLQTLLAITPTIFPSSSRRRAWITSKSPEPTCSSPGRESSSAADRTITGFNRRRF